jgi:hydroxypyruvate isomerase
MPRFSANLSTLFTEHPLLDRFAAARDLGFRAVEIQFPYDSPAELMRQAKERNGVEVALFNIPAGDLLRGGAGLAGMPGREGHFRAAVAEARLYVEALRPAAVNVLAGWPPPVVDRAACRAALITNLRYAAEVLAPYGVRVLLEPINSRDRPDSLIATTAAAREAIAAAGAGALALQYDVYHATTMGEDVVADITVLAPEIGHIQFADVPGRHEPGTGTIDFAAVFTAIDRSGYRGFVGAEYTPATTTAASMAWLRRYAG